MKMRLRTEYPNIVPCLVLPFEKTCSDGQYRFPALVFAQRGSVILFAIEYSRQFGVGLLDDAGEIEESDQFPTLDLASRTFLALHPAVNNA
jgi:hypothetical protein